MFINAKSCHQALLAKSARVAVCVVLSFAALSATTAMAGNTTYQYDALGRVVKVTYPDAKQICYAYDAAGNRTQVKRQATGTCTATGSVLALQASQAMLQAASDSAAQQDAIQATQNEAMTAGTTSDEIAPSF